MGMDANGFDDASQLQALTLAPTKILNIAGDIGCLFTALHSHW
jgi:hypothetical protein